MSLAQRGLHTVAKVEVEPGATAMHSSAGAQQKLEAKAQLPKTAEAAAARLQELGYTTGGRIDPADTAAIEKAHAFFEATYKADWTDKPSSLAKYLQDDRYDLRTVREGGKDVGALSAWKYSYSAGGSEVRALQIDYCPLLEAPRKKSNDVEAGLALIRSAAADKGADMIFVEVDNTDKAMAKHYKAAGFKTFAKGAGDLDMLVLPLNESAKERLTADPKGVWDAHTREWYDSNWDGVAGKAARPKEEALASIQSALAKDPPQMIWIQNLP